MPKEANIIINGKTLTFAQSMTLRVAICSFVSEMSEPDALGDDEHGRSMAKSYVERGTEVIGIIFEGLN